MNKQTVTRIPVPSEILKGEWSGIVYAIETNGESEEQHKTIADSCIGKIEEDFDNNSHYTVSLREVKRELVYADSNFERYCTLVQFRVRDSY